MQFKITLFIFFFIPIVKSTMSYICNKYCISSISLNTPLSLNANLNLFYNLASLNSGSKNFFIFLILAPPSTAISFGIWFYRYADNLAINDILWLWEGTVNILKMYIGIGQRIRFDIKPSSTSGMSTNLIATVQADISIILGNQYIGRMDILFCCD